MPNPNWFARYLNPGNGACVGDFLAAHHLQETGPPRVVGGAGGEVLYIRSAVYDVILLHSGGPPTL